MIILLNRSNNSVEAHWDILPGSFHAPGIGEILNPQIGWEQGDFKLIDDDPDDSRSRPPPEPPPYVPPTPEELAAQMRESMVNLIVQERERRLALGFLFTFADDRGTHIIGTSEPDMKGWSEVTTVANALIALGQGSTALNIVTNTGPCSLTALEWQAILLAAAQYRQPIWAKSFLLQAMSPIPADYADDAYWV